MPEKLIDKRKWDRYTVYLDIVIFLVLIGSIYLAIASALQAGYLQAVYDDTTAIADRDKCTAAYWGIMGSVALIALTLFWLFYRYFRARVERRVKW